MSVITNTKKGQKGVAFAETAKWGINRKRWFYHRLEAVYPCMSFFVEQFQASICTHMFFMQFSKIFLPETTRPKTFIFMYTTLSIVPLQSCFNNDFLHTVSFWKLCSTDFFLFSESVFPFHYRFLLSHFSSIIFFSFTTWLFFYFRSTMRRRNGFGTTSAAENVPTSFLHRNRRPSRKLFIYYWIFLPTNRIKSIKMGNEIMLHFLFSAFFTCIITDLKLLVCCKYPKQTL